jgi:hypothetical protein
MDFEGTAVNIITPVLEKAVILAAEYCGACGRDAITAKDFEYALKYCVRHTVGQHIGSILQDETEDDDEDDDDVEIIEETDEDGFTRYVGDDETFNRVNQAVDTWDEWTPESPVELYLFNAINSNEHLVG